MLKFLFSGKRLAFTLAVIVVGVVFCGLGIWQVRRLNERLMLIEFVKARMAEPAIPLGGGDPVDPDVLDYRRVELRGTFEPEQEILRRNRSVDGVTGYHIVTPFRLSGSDKAVLVDRGWIPYDEATPEQRKAFAPPSGEVVIEAVVQKSQDATTAPYDPPLAPGQDRLDAWFRIKVSRIQQQVSMPLLPIFVEQQATGDVSRELPIRGETAPPDPGNHMSYAIQWFSFAIILLGGYGAISYQQWLREYIANVGAEGARSLKPEVRP